MNRVALVWLMVATLVGCGGGSKSAPDPGPVVPIPLPEGLERQSELGGGLGGGGATISSNSVWSAPLQEEADWVEFLSPPFQQGETESFRVHLGASAHQLWWETASRDYVEDVNSNERDAYYATDYEDGQPLIYRASVSGGLDLQLVPGYEEVTVECTIHGSRGTSIVSMSLFPRHAPPAAGPIHHYGVIGMSGQVHTWDGGASSLDEFQWDFGGGATPNIVQGPQSVPTVLGAPGYYTARRMIRSEWGFSGPQEIGYWVQPVWSIYPLTVAASQTPTMLVFNDRIRLLLSTENGYRYGAALVADPKSALDWRFSSLPLPELQPTFLRMGVHDGRLLVIGGEGSSSGSQVIPYWRASTQAPDGPEDWDVGGIPDSIGLEVLDIRIDETRVGLLAEQADALVLVWDNTPLLSQWQFTEVADSLPVSRQLSNRLLLTDSGPAVVGFELLPGEPVGLSYRSATYASPDEWVSHRILDIEPGTSFTQKHAACIYQGRPLVLGRLDNSSSALFWSAVPRPMATGDWERLVTCYDISPINKPAMTTIDVQDDRLVMNAVNIMLSWANGEISQAGGGLLLSGDPADLANWTPFTLVQASTSEAVRATALTDSGIAVLTGRGSQLSFGMITP